MRIYFTPTAILTSGLKRIRVISGRVLIVCGTGICIFAGDTSQVPDTKPGEFEMAAPTDSAPVNHRVIADLNLELVWIKSGTFLMGSPVDEPLRDKAEGPQTRVMLSKGYWLGKTEVTQGQYEAVMGTNPSHFKKVGIDAPVEQVSWIDAMEFCRTLTERERVEGRLPKGYAFSLPTEAQWEYACRSETTGSFSGEPATMAWYDKNSNDTTHPVGTKQPNRWGLYDMSGNVLEWCLDWYAAYPGGAVTDPIGPKRGYYRMARGGSWRTDVGVERSAARSGGSPGRTDYTIGFRLALSANAAD